METFEIIIIGLGEKKYAVKALIFTREGMQYYSNGHHSKKAVQSIGLLCWLQAACMMCCTYLPLRKCKWGKGVLAKDSALFVLKTNAQKKKEFAQKAEYGLKEYKLRNKGKLQKEFDTNLDILSFVN